MPGAERGRGSVRERIMAVSLLATFVYANLARVECGVFDHQWLGYIVSLTAIGLACWVVGEAIVGVAWAELSKWRVERAAKK